MGDLEFFPSLRTVLALSKSSHPCGQFLDLENFHKFYPCGQFLDLEFFPSLRTVPALRKSSKVSSLWTVTGFRKYFHPCGQFQDLEIFHLTHPCRQSGAKSPKITKIFSAARSAPQERPFRRFAPKLSGKG